MWEYFHSIILWDSTRPAEETQKPMQSFPHCFSPFFSCWFSAVMRCCPVISHKMSQCQLYASPHPSSPANLPSSLPHSLSLLLSFSIFLFLCHPPRWLSILHRHCRFFLLCSGGPSEWIRDEADADRRNKKNKKERHEMTVWKRRDWWALSASVLQCCFAAQISQGFNSLSHCELQTRPVTSPFIQILIWSPRFLFIRACDQYSCHITVNKQWGHTTLTIKYSQYLGRSF